APVNAPKPSSGRPNLASERTLYAVGYAHLDTEWRWEYPQVIQEYLTKTMRNNFALFERYPHYIFNFTGANRYRLMKEYYPSDFERLKQYVAIGRWFPAGSSMEEGDVNSPNAESIIRQVLYGNNWFRREFGVASEEYMLPDCFGFPASLPSVLVHCGIKGFSTQKLTWGLAIGQIPFKVGMWEGTDGRSIVAALDPQSYSGGVKNNSAGSISSQAYMKRWNRKNEQLAQAAEGAATAAWWAMGGTDAEHRPLKAAVGGTEGMYPAQRIEDAWTLVLGSQMHDILPG